MAPVITLILFIAISAYGFFVVGGFEGFGYAIIGFGFLIVGVAGTLLLPWLARRSKVKGFGINDKLILIILPILFFAIIGSAFYFDQEYWIIDEGENSYMGETYYEVTTISEGRKQVTLVLGKEYSGKNVEVDNVSRWESTEITIKITDEGMEDKTPYIWIGLDEIKDPLTIQTTDGVVIE